MSGVMETRDRWLVADNPVSFDSDYMVFVSPPPTEMSKATSPIKPFKQTVTENYKTAFDNLAVVDVAVGHPHCSGVFYQSSRDGNNHSTSWKWRRR